MLAIYALQLINDKYYIGKTSRDVFNRFQEHLHCIGLGSEWTRTYQPIKILETYKTDSRFEEDILTKKYMMKYGIDNVRGGSYTKIVLDEWQIKALEHEFKSINDSCFNCGKNGHFADECEKYESEKSEETDLSQFDTIDKLTNEINRLTNERQEINLAFNKIQSLKYVYLNHIGVKIEIEPSIIKKYKMNELDIMKIGSTYMNTMLNNDETTGGDIYYTIIKSQIFYSLQEELKLRQENILENVYHIYVYRCKLEREFTDKLKQINLDFNNKFLFVNEEREDLMKQINERLEKLLKKLTGFYKS